MLLALPSKLAQSQIYFWPPFIIAGRLTRYASTHAKIKKKKHSQTHAIE